MRGVSVIKPDPAAQARLNMGALANGALQTVHADFYRQFDQEQLCVFGHRIAAYVLPTWELIEKLEELIREASPRRSAIEIGAGNGVLGQALGITSTDSFMQSDPAVARLYNAAGQPVIEYGEYVERIDALAAVERFQPEVVVAAWVTHLYTEKEAYRGGNMFGIDEVAMLKKIKRYIFVGHTSPHALKPLHDYPATTIRLDGLFSRGADPQGNVIWVWDNPEYTG